jgi:5-formyltetrahydrofolate cyclo-ligase
MESAINSEKDALRWAMRRAMAALTPEALHTMGKAAAALLAGQDCWKHCSQVLVFRSLKHEIDTAPLISLAQEQGKTAFVTPQT